MLSRLALGIAVGLAGLLIVGVILVARLGGAGEGSRPAPSSTSAAPRTGPVALVPVDAPQAGSVACANLLGALPDNLTSGSATLRRLPLAQPAPPATAAWGDGGDPVVLRCGLNRPPELTQTAELRVISGIKWLEPVCCKEFRRNWGQRSPVPRAIAVSIRVDSSVG
ncbi:MAG: DUF3515 domain-containing protein [Actinobacteria bacterium]|nr:DUF3515 domain-containing protein [Actinomycetota bacterium]